MTGFIQIVGVIVYLLVGITITKVFLSRERTDWDGDDHVLIGMASLIWPLFVACGILVGSFWLLGRVGSWLVVPILRRMS